MIPDPHAYILHKRTAERAAPTYWIECECGQWKSPRHVNVRVVKQHHQDHKHQATKDQP